jgi:hypothetical protein
MLFKPFNWYSAGLRSPIEYYKYALEFDHDFDRIVISQALKYDNTYYINGKCISTGDIRLSDGSYKRYNELCVFNTDITKNFNGTLVTENEGDFIIEYDNIKYRINTTIQTGIECDKGYRFTTDPINTINLDIPKDVIKMAMLVLQLEI